MTVIQVKYMYNYHQFIVKLSFSDFNIWVKRTRATTVYSMLGLDMILTYNIPLALFEMLNDTVAPSSAMQYLQQ